MKQHVEALFENGLLRPLGEIDLLEGERVRLEMELVLEPDPDDLLEVCAQHYSCLEADSEEAAELIGAAHA